VFPFPLLVALMFTAPKCAVDVSPRLSLPPLRHLRTRVTIEPNDRARVARLLLVDDGGHVRSSILDVDRRTQWIDWSVSLGTGEYIVVLDVYNDLDQIACHVEQRIGVGIVRESD
jgi:hypothetical protein